MTSGRLGYRHIVMGAKPWNRRIFEVISKYAGQWHFIGSPERLTTEAVQTLNPRYVFFLHWSWKVPDETIGNYECLCFQMANVFVDVSATSDIKTKAFSHHNSEVRTFPHPRSTEGLHAIARTWRSIAGYDGAGALEFVRAMR